MNKNRILILSRPLSNVLDEGNKNLVYYICKNSNQNLNVFVEKDFSLQLPKQISQIKIKITIDKKYVDNSRSFLVKLFIIKELLKFWKYDTIHTFFSLSSMNVVMLLFANMFLKKKILISLPALDQPAIDSRLVNLLFKKSAQILVMSDYTAERLEKYKFKITKIPPTINNEKHIIFSENEIFNIKKKLGILHDSIIIVPGEYNRLGINKNIVEIVKNSPKNILFIFSFRIKAKEDLKKEQEVKKQLSAHDNVLFLNTVNNYHEYAGISTLSVFPATKDKKFDLPLSLVELMAMGKPVIHTDIRPQNELYLDNSLFCVKNSPKLVSEKISILINDKKTYEKYKTKTILESKRFLPENVVPLYEKIYSKFL